MLQSELVSIVTNMDSTDRFADYKAMKPVMAYLWPALFGNPDAPIPFNVRHNETLRKMVVKTVGINPMPREMYVTVLRRVTNFLYVWTRRREYLEGFERHCTWYNADGTFDDYIDFDYIEGRLDVLYKVRMRKDLDAAWNKLAGTEQHIIDTRVKL